MLKKCALLFCLLLIIFSITVANPESGPTGLMVEFLRNPSLGTINTPFPGFSWIVNGIGKDSQESYQLRVSTSRKRLEAGEAEIWNSGLVKTSQSINVIFAGKPLNPMAIYFWNVTVGFVSSKKRKVSEIQEFKTGLFEKTPAVSVMPQIKHIIQPQKVIDRNSLGNYFADFGKAAFGTLRVQIESQNADSVVVHLGEKLEAPGIIKRNPGGTIRYRFVGLHVERGTRLYTLDIPHIPRHLKYPAIVMPAEVGEVTPFRYCEIETFSKATFCKSAEQIAVNYFWDDSASSFTCSDTILNQVWDLCKYSIKATSFCGIYVDGDRERTPYEGDAYINQLGHYCTDREYSIARYSTEYLMVNPTWPTEWSMYCVMLAYTDYLYTGDIRPLAKFYKDLKSKSLIALERDDGLISTRTGLMNESVLKDIHIQVPLKDIVDWPIDERDGNEMPEVNTVVNAFHYESLNLMEKIAGALGNGEDELFFRNKAEKVRKAMNDLLFDQTKGKYLDGEGSKHSSLHASIFPLAFGMVPEAKVSGVAGFISSRGMACSVYAAQFLLESLYAAGEDKAALDLMCSPGERGWWNMIRSGSTITLEAWAARFKPNLDWNHAWGAVPANLVTRGLWGIVPLSPGFGLTQVKPQTGGLTSSAIKVPTIKGPINCEFSTDNTSHFDLQVTIPSDMKAAVSVPIREIDNPELWINGKRSKEKSEGKFIRVEIEGGQTIFSVRKGRK